MPQEIGRSLLQRLILDESLLFYRKEDGTPVAMQNTCPHRSMPLSEGTLIGDTVRCAYHGLEFDPSGACTNIPGQSNIPPRWFDINADLGGLLARREVKRLLKLEQAANS